MEIKKDNEILKINLQDEKCQDELDELELCFRLYG